MVCWKRSSSDQSGRAARGLRRWAQTGPAAARQSSAAIARMRLKPWPRGLSCRPMLIKILFLGDIVGEPGRRAVIESLPHIRDEHGIDFIIVNGENSANGRGITPKISIDLLRAGAAVITSGDHIWDQREIHAYLPTEPRLLRPINYPPGAPGGGSIILETAKGPVGVINVQGRTFMKLALENPFHAIRAEVEKMREQTKVIFVDVHAEATSEKVAMGRFLDGQVSAVVGTHTHVQTSDERILPGGTAFLVRCRHVRAD